MSSSTLTVPPENNLTAQELEAYRKYETSGKPPLSPSTAANFFGLYLLGHSAAEIARLNPAFGLGIIVKAKVDHKWDEQKEQYMLGLLEGVRSKVQKAQLEAVGFAADAMAVYQKMAGDKFKKYLQTGDVDELGGMKDMTLKTYKDFVELILKLTGQADNKKVSGEVFHRHMVDETPVARADRPMTSLEADEFLKIIDKKKE